MEDGGFRDNKAEDDQHCWMRSCFTLHDAGRWLTPGLLFIAFSVSCFACPIIEIGGTEVASRTCWQDWYPDRQDDRAGRAPDHPLP